MFRDWTISVLDLFDWIVTNTFGIIITILTTPLDSFAPGAFALSEQVATILTGFGLSLLTMLWMIDFVSSTITFRVQNIEEIAKLLLLLILGAVLVRSSFWFILSFFQALQFVFAAVNHAGSIALDGVAALSFSDFVSETQDFVADLASGEAMLMLLFVVIFLLATFGAMLSILLVPIAIVIELYIYSALSPIPIATLVTSQKQIGIQFLKNYASVCIRGALVLFGMLLSQAVLNSEVLNFPDMGEFMGIDMSGFRLVFTHILQMFINLMVMQTGIKNAEKFSRAITGG